MQQRLFVQISQWHFGKVFVRGTPLWSKTVHGILLISCRSRLVAKMWTSAWKKNYSCDICQIYSDNLAVCLYIKFSFCLYLVENVWNNVMTSFRILASFACFLRYFQTRITTTKFDCQKTGTHISQITTLFCCFFCYFVTGVEKWNLFFFQIMILEHLHFCFANHACVSHLLRGQPHLLECYYRNCLIGAHMCVHPVSEWSDFFYPSVWIVHKLQCFK